MAIGNQIYQMMPIIEFLERLAESRKGTQRNCNNELEDDRH